MANRFPQTYSKMAGEDLLSAFSAAPSRLNHVLKDLTVHDLRAQPRPGKWSIQQITMHLADAEIMGAARIRQAFAEPGKRFAVYEQDIWAVAFDYQQAEQKTFYSAIMLFDALRLATAKILQRAGQQDWNKFGVHPEWGELTLRQLLELYADHGERHIAQILELRALLGKPLEYELLLKDRLF
jgi:uncharacterized damage-inducible protein DinB